MTVVDPTREQVLEFCAREPVERVFLEDVARRGLGQFFATENDDGTLASLCHIGANLVPSGDGCEAYADAAAAGNARMIIGEARAVTAVWDAARDALPRPREDRPGQQNRRLAQERQPERQPGQRPGRVHRKKSSRPARGRGHTRRPRTRSPKDGP